MKINGVEFDIDFMDAETAERYEAAYEEYGTAYKAYAAELASSGKSYSLAIRRGCELVFNFIETLIGDGACNEIFGDECNLRECFKAFNEITAEFERQQKALAELVGSDTPKNSKFKRP